MLDIPTVKWMLEVGKITHDDCKFQWLSTGSVTPKEMSQFFHKLWEVAEEAAKDAKHWHSAVQCCPVLGCGACVPAHVFEGVGRAHAYYRVGEAIARPPCTTCRLHSLCIRSCLV